MRIQMPCAMTGFLAALLGSVAWCAAQAVTGANLGGRNDAWFMSEAGIRQIDSIISWQRPEGGWEKGYNPAQPHVAGTLFGDWGNTGAIDNGLTYTELRDIARAYRLTKRETVLAAFNRGIDYLITMQYPNGGWPQRFPLPDNYGRNITFNDNAMVNVMRLLRDVAQNTDFSFVDDARRAKAKQAFDRGLDCILKCQIVTNGKRTAWGQQHDPQTLAPTGARTYELPSVCSSESAGIVELFMSLENPSPEQQRAVHAAAAWFEASKITGKRVQRVADDLVVVDDPAAPVLWARFYEIDTNRPFYCGRDGVKKYSLAEIEKERRTGYAWLRDWGRTMLVNYDKWKAKYPSMAPSNG